MKKTNVWGLLFVALVVFQGVASAKEVSGKIAGTDAAANRLSLTAADPASGKESNVDILVNSTTTYAGAASLADLTVGQEVTVEATEDAASGGWIADSVKVAEPLNQAAPAAPVAEEPAK